MGVDQKKRNRYLSFALPGPKGCRLDFIRSLGVLFFCFPVLKLADYGNAVAGSQARACPHVLALRTFLPKSFFNTSTEGRLHNPPGTERPSERKAYVKSKLREERPVSVFYQFTEYTQKVPSHCLSSAFYPQI